MEPAGRGKPVNQPLLGVYMLLTTKQLQPISVQLLPQRVQGRTYSGYRQVHPGQTDGRTVAILNARHFTEHSLITVRDRHITR